MKSSNSEQLKDNRGKINIVKAEAFATPMPFIKPFTMAKGTITHSENVCIRLEDQEGRVGWGECYNVPVIYGRGYKEIHQALTTYLLPAIVGIDPLEIGKINYILDGALPGSLDAKSGIDMAVYDLLGKQLEVPVYKLLGGKHTDTIPVIAESPIAPPEEVVEMARKDIEKGHKYYKLKLGGNWKEDIERVRAVREAVGDSIIIKGDANANYTRDTALKVISALENVNMQYFEQPLKQYDFAGCAWLAERVNTPISADEDVQTVHDAFKVISMQSASNIVIKLLKHGGLYRSSQIASMCETVGVPISVSSGTETSLGRAALLHFYAANPSSVGAMEIAEMLSDDLVDENERIYVKPTLKVPEGHGLGVNVNEQKIEQYKVQI